MTAPKFKGRREDLRLLTGQGRYTADFNLPQQLHAAFLRSEHGGGFLLPWWPTLALLTCAFGIAWLGAAAAAISGDAERRVQARA